MAAGAAGTEPCPHCGRPFKRLRAHLPHCKAAPAAPAASPGPGPAPRPRPAPGSGPGAVQDVARSLDLHPEEVEDVPQRLQEGVRVVIHKHRARVVREKEPRSRGERTEPGPAPRRSAPKSRSKEAPSHGAAGSGSAGAGKSGSEATKTLREPAGSSGSPGDLVRKKGTAKARAGGERVPLEAGAGSEPPECAPHPRSLRLAPAEPIAAPGRGTAGNELGLRGAAVPEPTVSTAPGLALHTEPTVSTAPGLALQTEPTVSMAPGLALHTEPVPNLGTAPGLALQTEPVPNLGTAPGLALPLTPQTQPSLSPALPLTPQTQPSLSLALPLTPQTQPRPSPALPHTPQTQPSLSPALPHTPQTQPSLSPALPLTPQTHPRPSPALPLTPQTQPRPSPALPHTPQTQPSLSPALPLTPQTQPLCSARGLEWFPELYPESEGLRIFPGSRFHEDVRITVETARGGLAQGQQGPLAQRPLMEVRLGELHAWISTCSFSAQGLLAAAQRAWGSYCAKYIHVKQGGPAGISMLLAGYCLLSYGWNYQHFKRHRWRKYH